jgi:hypothetical protein
VALGAVQRGPGGAQLCPRGEPATEAAPTGWRRVAGDEARTSDSEGAWEHGRRPAQGHVAAGDGSLRRFCYRRVLGATVPLKPPGPAGRKAGFFLENSE